MYFLESKLTINMEILWLVAFCVFMEWMACVVTLKFMVTFAKSPATLLLTF